MKLDCKIMVLEQFYFSFVLMCFQLLRSDINVMGERRWTRQRRISAGKRFTEYIPSYYIELLKHKVIGNIFLKSIANKQ
jgi:hypothetical protein